MGYAAHAAQSGDAPVAWLQSVQADEFFAVSLVARTEFQVSIGGITEKALQNPRAGQVVIHLGSRIGGGLRKGFALLEIGRAIGNSMSL
jgi:hypothetical protein